MFKTLFVLFFIMNSYQIFATEIQCKTNLKGIEIAVKKSPDTGRFYLLLFQGDDVSVCPLNEAFVRQTENDFQYTDEQVDIRIVLEDKSGSLSFSGEKPILLSDCLAFSR